MTLGPKELKAALQRLIDDDASEADRDAVRMALKAGVLVTGAGAVAIGGKASDVIITTGDQNIVFSFKDADAATVLTAIYLLRSRVSVAIVRREAGLPA